MMGQKGKQKEQYEYIAAINQHCKNVCLSLSKTVETTLKKLGFVDLYEMGLEVRDPNSEFKEELIVLREVVSLSLYGDTLYVRLKSDENDQGIVEYPFKFLDFDDKLNILKFLTEKWEEI
jgi:hypothetical protein